MTAKFAGALPEGDANGLGPVVRHLIDRPHDLHVVVALLDCKRTTTDNDTGDVVPTARIRRIEVVVDAEDKALLRRLLERALERRTGATVLPFELEADMRSAFDDVDEVTGELPPVDDEGTP